MSERRFADRRVISLCFVTAALATTVGVLVNAPVSYAAVQCDKGKYHTGYKRDDTVTAGNSVSVHISEDSNLTGPIDFSGSVRGRIWLQDTASNSLSVGLRDLGPGSGGLQGYVEWNGGTGSGNLSTHAALPDSTYTIKYTNDGNNKFEVDMFNGNWGLSMTKTFAGGTHTQSYDVSSDQATTGTCNGAGFIFTGNSRYTRADMKYDYSQNPYWVQPLPAIDNSAFEGWGPQVG